MTSRTYHAVHHDLALDAVDLAEALRVAPSLAQIVEPYWPLDGAILISPAPSRQAFVLIRDPEDAEREARLNGLIDLLQRVIGPAKIKRPIRCYRFDRTRWREIDPRRRPSVTIMQSPTGGADPASRRELLALRQRLTVSVRRQFRSR